MNIIQITTKLDTSDSAEDVVNATKFLTLNGHKVVVVSQNGERLKEIDELGARHYKIPTQPNIFVIPIAIFKLSKIILKENIQIVHARCAFSSFVAFFASRFTGKVFVSTIYKEDVKGLFERAQFWAKRIILFSETQASHFVEKGYASQDKIRVIPPAVLYEEKALQGIKPDKEICSLGDYFIIGSVLPSAHLEGGQNFIKSISLLSRIIYKLKVFIINRMSLYEKDHMEKLELLLKRLTLNNIVTFLPQTKFKKFMSRFDLFVEINEDEKNPTRLLLQSKAQGIPSMTVTIAETKSPKDLATKVLSIYRNKKLQEEMANREKEFIRTSFGLKKIMEVTLNLYEDAITSISILIIKIGALGDAILATPSIRAIREKFSKAKIKLLVGIDNRDVFINCPFVDDVIICDFKERDKALKGLLRVGKKLRAEYFDMVIDLQNNRRSHLLSFLSCAPQRFGYDNGKLSILLNRKIRDTKIPIGPIEHQSRVLGLLGIYNIDKRLELWPTEEDEEWARSFLKSHWVKDNAKLIAINVTSSSRWLTKLWPIEYFIEVCNRLAKDFGIRIILIGSDKEDLRAEEFLKRTKCKPINALGKTSIPRLASLIKRCDLSLSSDSAPIHIAASVNTPFIALFGPTDPLRHLAPVKENVVLKKDFPCVPCYHTHCDRGYICMRSIKPDEVYDAILKLLGIKAISV